jgi:hypothetical protein
MAALNAKNLLTKGVKAKPTSVSGNWLFYFSEIKYQPAAFILRTASTILGITSNASPTMP